jgi:peptidyl-prolyl cis-trans isomerase A (cyclophilin A)
MLTRIQLLAGATALVVTSLVTPTHASKEKLMNPQALTETAPDSYRVRVETSKGDFVIAVTREWAPKGADRFYNLVKHGYYDEHRFFRVLPGFVVQWGISGDPELNKIWQQAQFPDEAGKQSNKKGRITFAKGGPNSRTTQVFINLTDNARLDSMGFPPFGEVVEGLAVVEKLHAGYGEGAPSGRGPNQGRIQSEGNAYLKKEFAELDFIKRATLVTEKPKQP